MSDKPFAGVNALRTAAAIAVNVPAAPCKPISDFPFPRKNVAMPFKSIQSVCDASKESGKP